jgi:hypothetical protein
MPSKAPASVGITIRLIAPAICGDLQIVRSLVV